MLGSNNYGDVNGLGVFPTGTAIRPSDGRDDFGRPMPPCYGNAGGMMALCNGAGAPWVKCNNPVLVSAGWGLRNGYRRTVTYVDANGTTKYRTETVPGSGGASFSCSGGGGGGGDGPSPLLSAVLKITGLTAGAAYLGYSALYDVQPGHVAVIYSRISGIKDQTVDPGTHFLIPFIERPIIYDIRKRPRNIHSLTGSKDLQMVNLNLRVLTRPRVTSLPQMYEKLGLDYDDKVLPSIVNEVCKMVVAQYYATQLLTERKQMSRRIKELLVERAQEFDIIMDDVAMIEIKFSPEFRNRLDDIIQFSKLSKSVIISVVDKCLEELQVQLDDKQVHMQVTDAARRWFAEKGYDEDMGASMSFLVSVAVKYEGKVSEGRARLS